jgi:hypothetical protein
VVKTTLPETEALKQQFVPEMLRRYQAGQYDPPAAWETDRIHTSFGLEPRNQVIATLPPAYERLLRQFVSVQRMSVALWHNVYWTGGEYQEKHHHIPAHISFIHFLLFDPAEHKAPLFYDPARTVKAYCRHPAIPPEYSSESSRIEVKEGDVLVFPSYVEHHVPPGRYSTPRITVSMNVTLPPPQF